MTHRALFFACFAVVNCLLVQSLSAQTDTSLLLSPERLEYKHIINRDVALRKPQALSATRSLEDLDQLPFTVWVVTAEDILRFGFVTLGDVLRAAPGIRVSQPGNAVEGETFLMRGLSGNQHVKVLINDVPIVPTGANGMSIGAQMPIRQAERIEVVYGPNGVLYGNDACAGVVNIILKETERPVFTQADLSFGNNGFNNLDLMFGGKLGHDRNLFRFSLYGSSTIRDRWDVYDNSITTHNPYRYLVLGLRGEDYLNNPNFQPADTGRLDPKLAQIAHESRLFGGNFTWRGFHFTYHRMARLDHSALGLNPFSVSWSNPGNRLSERTSIFSIGLQNKKKTLSNTFSFIRYRVDNTSSATYLFNRLTLAEYKIRQDSTLPDDQRADLIKQIFARTGSGERYAVANSFDARFESRLHLPLRNNFRLDAGIQLNLSNGAAVTYYYSRPADAKIGVYNDRAKPFSVPILSAESLTSNLFTQLAWNGKRLRLLASVATFASVNEIENVVTPMRFAALYRFDSTWSIYANYGTGFRPANGYENANRFTIYDNGAGKYDAYQRWSDPFPNLEKTGTFEAGLRYVRGELSASGSVFHQNAYHLIRAGYLLQQDGPSSNAFWDYGYANAPGRALTMWGIQGLLASRGQQVAISRGKRSEIRLRGRTEFFFQYSEGKEWFGEPFPASNEIRNSPRWITQFRTWTGTDKFEVMIASNLQQSTLSKASTYREFWQRESEQHIERYPRFRSWDVMLRLYLSKHLVAYCLVQNVFNREISGLDATGTPEDLNLPIQQGRSVRFGVNYNLGE